MSLPITNSPLHGFMVPENTQFQWKMAPFLTILGLISAQPPAFTPPHLLGHGRGSFLNTTSGGICPPPPDIAGNGGHDTAALCTFIVPIMSQIAAMWPRSLGPPLHHKGPTVLSPAGLLALRRGAGGVHATQISADTGYCISGALR